MMIWVNGAMKSVQCPVKARHSFLLLSHWTEVSNEEALCLSSIYTNFDQDTSFLCIFAQVLIRMTSSKVVS